MGAADLIMLTVACFKWTPRPGYRSTFGPETVNTLARMVGRHYHGPHRVVCITDNPSGIDARIDIVPLWDDFADLPNPSGPTKGPSCYRRLKLFAPEMADVLGPRFVALDLDCVITADVTPLWDRAEDFVIWGDTTPGTPYNGSMFLMTAGARAKVWTDFDPVRSPQLTSAIGYYGSDQAWISHCLGPNERRWTRADGVYSYRNDVRRANELPRNARFVSFHGQIDPWSAEARCLPWIREHYK